MNYQLYQILLIFAYYSIIGWVVEQGLYGISGRLVNRGLLKLPVCPTYGIGALIIIYALTPIKDNFVYTACAALLICILLELLVIVFIKVLSGVSLWRYYFIFTLIGAFFSLIMIYHVQFLVDKFMYIMPMWLHFVFLLIFYLLFISDAIDGIDLLIKYRKNMKLLKSLDVDNIEYGDYVCDFLENYVRWIKAYKPFRKATMKKIFAGHSPEEIEVIKKSIREHLK